MLKRCHLMTVAAGQAILDEVVPEMTPARFDLLCCIRQWGIRCEHTGMPMGQQRIRRLLDLHSSTVSKMLTRLEEMGWIKRTRDYDDRRKKVVELTALGLRKIWHAMRFMWRGPGLVLHEDFKKIARIWRPGWPTFEALEHIDETLQLIARFFGDDSRFYYWYGQRNCRPFSKTGFPKRVGFRQPRMVNPLSLDPTN